MINKRDYKKDFLGLMKNISYRYSAWKVWNDFLCISAIAMANSVPGEHREEREKQYLSIISRYRKEEQEIFPKLMAIVVMAFEDNPEQDFLGTLYHELNLRQEQKGQYFTPYHICELMAEIQFNEAGDNRLYKEVKKKGFVSVSDSACGAGALLIAFANAAGKHHINYQKKVLFVAQDIDATAAMMCYVQLSLLGCSAIIIIGDTFARPGFHPDNEIWYTPFYYLNAWRFKDKDCIYAPLEAA